jgi:hypothetical protein
MARAGRLAAAFLCSLAACSDTPSVSGQPQQQVGVMSTPIPTLTPDILSLRPAAVVDRCTDNPQVALFMLPATPRAGGWLGVIAVAEKPVEAVLLIRGSDGREIIASRQRRGGPPYWWYLEIPAPPTGGARAILARGRDVLACKDVTIAAPTDSPAESKLAGAWVIRSSADRAMENFYSAWIEALFDAPVDEQLSFASLQEVLSDPRRNLLFNYLGLAEDDLPRPDIPGIEPDCADLPYVLRAYFAYKMGLPFGYSRCTRGGDGQPPQCEGFRSNLELAWPGRDPVADLAHFLSVDLADSVHSGSGRVPASSESGDYYPVPLSAASLRPGTVYADPYGHILVVVRRIPQTKSSGGMLLAVDAQPDGTVARRRYWRGNFLFADDPALGSPGFKRFRPLAFAGSMVRPLRNEEISDDADYGDYSLEQYEGGVDGFYDRVDDVLSPAPLEPTRALRETIDALHEQVKGRVLSVNNGTQHMAESKTPIAMPDGAEIFETTGPWEDFATPSRDLRLLIAIDVVRNFPRRVARRPKRYSIPAGGSIWMVKEKLDAMLRSELERRRFAYTRSDGTDFTLSLAELLNREAALEMAYNPNDCPEIRWGAPPGSDEAGTCRRHAPASQLAKMREYQPWFHERTRPPR